MPEHTSYFTISTSKTARATLISLAMAGFSCVIAGILLFIYISATTKLPLQTTINGVAVGNLTPAAAKQVLLEELPSPPPHTVTITMEGITVASSSAELGATYEIDDALSALTEPPVAPLHWRVYTTIRRYLTPYDIRLKLSYRPELLAGLLVAIEDRVNIAPIAPGLTLGRSGVVGTLTVQPGTIGRAIESQKTLATVIANAQVETFTTEAPVASVGAVLAEEEEPAALERGTALVGSSLKLTREGIPFTLTDRDLISLLLLPSGYNDGALTAFIAEWEDEVNRPPQEPELTIDQETLEVASFTPPRNGLTLDREQTKAAILAALTELENSSDETAQTIETELVLVEQPPKKSLASTNELGIQERIGFGDSYYAHSIPNRIHNVALATSRISLDIIKPGEEFSFNKHLGDVSGATGYKSAYVIQGNKTVLGDGGGVCQVSTTLFRSVLNAGLPVTRRLPHSYRVSYYELDRKPGVDATVYSGETDFRFKNDTGHHILVFGQADSSNLYMYFELYGTSDGRTAEIVDHKTWNFKPAPPPVYIPDPSLPPGKTVQVDWSAAGISASFKNVVRDKNGAVVREEEYVSHYRPWSAKYLRGI